jgi:hypothetical protein
MAALTNRYVTLQKEAAYGTEPTASTAGQYLGECDDESFAQSFDLLTRTDMARYGPSKTVAGLKYGEGDVNLPLQLDDFNAWCLFSAFGVDTYAAGSPKTHTLTETTNDALFPSFTVRVGRETKEHTYTGALLNSVSLSANINEYVMMTYSFVTCGESSTSALQTPGAGSTNPPAFGTTDALHFSKAYVRFEAAASSSNFSAMVKSIELDISMNRDTDNASSLGGATYSRKSPPTNREITGSIEFNQIVSTAADNEPTYDELRAFLLHNGSDSAPAISLNFQDASGNYLVVTLPKVAYEAPSSNVSGRDTQTMSVSFQVLYDETAGYMAKMQMGMDGINGDTAMTA